MRKDTIKQVLVHHIGGNGIKNKYQLEVEVTRGDNWNETNNIDSVLLTCKALFQFIFDKKMSKRPSREVH